MFGVLKFPFQKVSQLSAILSVLIGVLDLIGWIFDVEFLKRIQPNFVPMNPVTGVSFIFCGLGLLSLQQEKPDKMGRWSGHICAWLVIGLGALKLHDVFFSAQIQVDEWFFPSKLANPSGTPPSRMSPNTAFNFVLLGLAMLTTEIKWRDGWRPAQIFAFIPLLLALVVLTGYVAGIQFFYVAGPFFPMALHTATAFLIVSTGLLCARAEVDAKAGPSVGRKITSGFALGIAFLVLAAAVSCQSVYALVENSRMISHSQEILANLADVRLQVVQLENRRRGFLLSSSPELALLFRDARARAAEDLRHLHELTSDNPVQQNFLAQLDAAVREEIAVLSHSIDSHLEKALTEDEKARAPREGQQWREEIRGLLNTMTADEKTRLERRQGATERILRQTMSVMIFGGLVVILLAGIATFIVRRDLAARQQIENKLKEGEALFQGLFEFAPDAIVVVSRAGTLVRANAQAERIFGYTREELLGQCLETLIPERFRDRHVGHRNHYMAEQKRRPMGVGLNLFCRRKDGSEFPVDIMLSPMESPQGEQVIAVVRDITERKKVEERLRDSEAEFRTLAEAVPQIVWATRPDGWNIYFNQQWMDYTGLTLEESTGHGWNKPFHPDDQQRAWDAWQAATTKLVTYSLEARLRRADGVYRWWLIRGEPLKDASGKILKWFGTCTDIHDLKLAEDALKESEQRVRLAAEVAGVAVWECDTRNNTLKWDEQMFVIYGVTPTVGGLVNYECWSSRVLPEDLAEQEKQLQQTLATCGRSQREFRIKRASDDSVRFIHAAEIAIGEVDGKAVRLVGINVDITERKRAEEKVARSLREKELLLKEIHHRVKNNMQVVSSLLQLQARQFDQPQTRGMFIESQDRIKSMALIHEKLYQSPDLGHIDFAEYISSLAHMIARSYPTKSGLVRIDVQSDPIWLSVQTGVPVGLIFNELLSNSLKYAFPNDQPGIINVSLRDKKEIGFELVVRDNGVGLPGHFSLENSKSLGLRLVKIMAEQIDANLDFKSDQGAEFRLTFHEVKS